MIEVAGLTRTYGSVHAVEDVTFSARPGLVTGFLGPNGAGKSTTMRVLVGLTPPTRGTATIGGRRFADLPNPGREVGVLLDASAQHSGRTGREMLRLGAMTMGLPMSRVEEMLALVGLTSTEAGRRIRTYSLGMRQRLGIAHALLGDPQVLVLDEPANGLDPAGIRWMRELLAGFAARGGTVLLSSHLLHEVELVADELILIGGGRILAQGDQRTLLAGRTEATYVTAEDNDALARALLAAGHAVSPAGGGLRVECAPLDVGRVAAAGGLALSDLRSAAAGLEELFFELTASAQREGVTGTPVAGGPPMPPAHQPFHPGQEGPR